MKKLNLFKSLFLAILLCAYSFAGAANKYVKVTEDLADWTGTYLIVCEDQSLALNGALQDLDVTKNTVPVKIETNGEIIGNSKIDSAVFKFAQIPDGYSIQAFSKSYMGFNASKNGLDTSTVKPILNSVLYETVKNSAVILSGKTPSTLAFNKAADQMRFRYYKTPGTTSLLVQLYKLDETPTAVETPMFSVAAGDRYAAFDLELTCATEGAKIFYNIDGGAETEYTKPIHIEKTSTVNAWSVKGAEKSRVVTAKYVFWEANKVTTLRAFLDGAANNPGQNYVINETVQVLLIHEKTNRIVLFDNTATAMVYDTKLSKTLKVGDKLTNIECKDYKYGGKVQMEITNIPVLEHAELAPQLKPMYEIELADTNKLVLIRDVRIYEDVVFVEAPQAAPVEVLVKDGTNYLSIRSHFTNFADQFRADDRVDVMGIVGEYAEKPQIRIASMRRVKPEDTMAANLKEFISKATADTTGEFTITGKVTVTFVDKINHEIYFQDETAATSTYNTYYDGVLKAGMTLTNMKATYAGSKERIQLEIVSLGDQSTGPVVADLVRIKEILPTMEDRLVKIEKLRLVNSIIFDEAPRTVEAYDKENYYIDLNSKFRTAKGSFDYDEEVYVTGIVQEDFGYVRINIVDIKSAYDVVLPKVATPELSVPEGVKSKAFDLTITCATEGAQIFYKVNTGAAVKYTAPIHIDKNTSLTVWAEKGADKSAEVKAIYEFPEITFVPDLAGFIEAAQKDKYSIYGIEGTIVVTYKFGAQIFVQDASAAMVMLNEEGLANRVKIGDHLTGLVASCNEYKNEFQLHVEELPAPVAGKAVADIVRIADVSDAIANRFVEIQDVEIQSDVRFNPHAENAANVVVKDKDGRTMEIRAHFRNVNQSFRKGDKVTVTGIVSVYRNEAQLKIVSIRKVGETPVENVELESSVYSSNGMLFVEAEAGAAIEVYSIDGRCVASMVAESDLTAINVDADMVIVRVNGECHKMILK